MNGSVASIYIYVADKMQSNIFLLRINLSPKFTFSIVNYANELDKLAQHVFFGHFPEPKFDLIYTSAPLKWVIVLYLAFPPPNTNENYASQPQKINVHEFV